MKNSILNLGKVLNKTEQKSISGGNSIVSLQFCMSVCWANQHAISHLPQDPRCEQCSRDHNVIDLGPLNNSI